MNKVTQKLLGLVSDLFGKPDGAYNIREDSLCAGRKSSEYIRIESKTDKPGIDIIVDAGAKGEKVYIPACVTHSDVDDLVYNDFYIGAGADVIIIAGCGIHTDGEGDSRHNGIHRFFVETGAHVLYLEKHIGIGEGTGKRVINPQTIAEIARDGFMEMDTTQIEGVDSTKRITRAVLGEGARLVIREKIMTHGSQSAVTDFEVELNGDGSGADLVSRSVAKGASKQLFRSRIYGNAVCSGHSECDAIIMDGAEVSAVPELTARHVDAALIHEAAIGKIAGEQIIKLMTFGLTEKQAETKIIEGFLK
ncbi:SufB/SufD family protein [Christensenella tenuis]|uniref:SufD family Fe-S cluster assembly protein n=1 Tax=Christensenella tenuis TaxID=2763033 RepID=A0ABR7EGB8_9FIRM|nr:SufD family Fe-S cluster assembly protein [Christensenella tenuis]MBC5648796.1 SufD family Fe-S cluster assembly protein [Christensenella tenuis]